MSVIGNAIWPLGGDDGRYYLFRSGRGDSSAWDGYAQSRRIVTIDTNAISITANGSGSTLTWVSVQYKAALDSILPNYNTLYVEFNFSTLSGGGNSNNAFGIAKSLRTSQGDYSWYIYQTFRNSSTNTRVTLSLDVSSINAGYFAFEGPFLGDIYNIWLE